MIEKVFEFQCPKSLAAAHGILVAQAWLCFNLMQLQKCGGWCETSDCGRYGAVMVMTLILVLMAQHSTLNFTYLSH